MAIRASSLEDFLKKYTSQTHPVNLPQTIEDFAHLGGYDPEGKYLDAVRAAMQTRARGGFYGAEGERLGGIGQAGGYREHLKELAEAKFESRVDAAEAERAEADRRLRSGYADYLTDYKREQSSLKDTLRSRLLSAGIIDLETTYSIGVSRGLSADEAASLSAEIYSLRRDKVFAEALLALATARLDEESIKSYAERSGLIPEDVAELIKEARRYAVNGEKYTDEMLHRLEELAGKDFTVRPYNDILN